MQLRPILLGLDIQAMRATDLALAIGRNAIVLSVLERGHRTEDSIGRGSVFPSSLYLNMSEMLCSKPRYTARLVVCHWVVDDEHGAHP